VVGAFIEQGRIVREAYDVAMTPAAVAPFCPDSNQFEHQCWGVIAAVLRARSYAHP
jgi:hypothetical protein